MDDSIASLIGLIASLACGVICAAIAARKYRNGIGWFFLGMIFGPIAIMVVVVAGPLGAHESSPMPDGVATVEMLKTLANLRDRGAITEREFEVQKRRVLDRQEGADLPAADMR